MKHFSLLFFLTIICTISYGQSGQGYKFRYDAAGYRVKREFYTTPISYIKPGREQETDTLIGAFEEENNALSEKHQIVVKAYPNPVHDMLFLENFSWKKGTTARIVVFDINGKKVIEEATDDSKKEISFRALSPGTYQVNYQITNEKFFTWKIVKL